MSDTWRLNAIVLAMLIIANKKIAQAGYDKTRRGVISLVIDKTSGKYKVKYQDSLFLAYATSSDVYYEIGQLVSFLVPGNDWSREITILSGVKNYATNYAEVPLASLLYNKTGPNPLKINDLSNKRTVYGLCSYKDIEDSLVYKDEDDKEEPFLTINQLIGRTYIPRGNGLVIGMDVQTSLDSAQVNGNYGLRFDLIFRNILTGSLNSEIDFSQGGAAVRSYFVTDRDVIGNPYGLTKTTTVEHLLNIDDINPADFVGIKDIVAYCNGFPLKSEDKDNDIFFSNIHINGVEVLSELDLNGYVVHIDYSETGQIIEKVPLVLEGELPKIITVKLLASLKVNGKKVTSEDLLSYYWFRLNGLIFRNSPRYSSYGGDGWECLNNFSNGEPSLQNNMGKPIPATNTIYFTSGTKRQDVPLTIPANAYNTRIKCVIVYKYKETSGFLNVINKNVENFYIDSNLKQSGNDSNKVDYYLDYGMPTLTCLPLNYNPEKDTLDNYIFRWSVIPARGQGTQINLIDDERYSQIIEIKDQYGIAQKEIERVPEADLDIYKSAKNDEGKTYQDKVDAYESIKNFSYVKENVYYNFPISSIINYSRIICNVYYKEEKEEIYKGSASITLYNHTQVPDTYSLNIENSTQVFQYDGKGNSPTSPQLEKPLLIKPLTFTLIDDEGNQVSYLQIINNGYVEWIVPILNTLLISDNEKNGEPLDDALLIGTDKALAASLGYEVNIYKRPSKELGQTSSLASFAYKIEDTYDSKKINNNIRLDVKYKDMLFTAYTDFTFPKDGDPGTNGTDYVAKLIPINSDEETINTDRLYVDSKGDRYTDNGNLFDKLKFLLYNNSNVVNNDVDFWTCPPVTSFEDTIADKIDENNKNHYINVNQDGKIERNPLDNYNVLTDKVVDIVRAQNGTGNDIKYFALYPICFSYLNNNNYRFKVRPKTGFKYVVYALDGTFPDYDKTLPFEIIVEEYRGYYIEITDGLSYLWDIVEGSYLLLDNKLNENNGINIILNTETTNNKCYFKPKDKFVSTDLFSAIFVRIKKGNISLGWLHIPIYMIINRYGHSALNGWDGTSIQMKLGGDTILAPQVGAGTKNSNNQFTGILIGDVKTGNDDKNKQGLFGYHLGLRSIFLDATTGNATFGKQGAAQIKIDATTNLGTISSGDYTPSTSGHNGKGLKIKFSSTPENISDDNPEKGPYIRFGSNRFSVNAKGLIHAAGSGDIAGWNINDEAIYKHDGTNKTGMRSAGGPAFYAGTNDQSTNSYNFYVNHNGYLFGKSGNIAGWDFNDKSLSKSDVGMNSDPNNSDYTSITGHNSKAFFANGDKFYVTHDGYLKSTSGDIGGWDITATELKKADTQGNRLTLSPTAGISLYNINSTNGEKFTVNAAGFLTSTSGTIGGWHIEKDKLWAVGDGSNNEGQKAGIRLSANGSMSGGEGYNEKNGTGEWSINPDGTSSFNSITVDNAYISTGYFGTKNSKVTIDNGGIHGTGFDIKPGGADFKSLTINGDGVVTSSEIKNTGITGGSGTGAYSLGSGAATFNPSGTLTSLSDPGKTNYKDFMEWTVDDLVVKGTFTVKDENGLMRDTKWKNIIAVTGLKSIAIPTNTTYIYASNTKNTESISVSLSNISFSFTDKDNISHNVTGVTGNATIPANTFLTSVTLKEQSTQPASGISYVTAASGIDTTNVKPKFNYQGIAFLGDKDKATSD